jgi:hypothetical protein
MISSSYLQDGPYFGRGSPFRLAESTGVKFPLSILDHTDNMKARADAHRGIQLQRSAFDVLRMAAQLDEWVANILDVVEVWERNHERQKYEVY